MKNVVEQIDSPCIKDIAEKETVTLKQAVRIIDYTQWDLEDITQGLDELSSCGYVLDLIDDENNQTLSNYYFRKNICLNEDDNEIQMEE